MGSTYWWQAAWLQIAEKGDRTNESEDGGDSDVSLAYSYERKLSRDLDQLLEPAGLAFKKHIFFWYLCLEQTLPSLASPSLSFTALPELARNKANIKCVTLNQFQN